MDTYYGEMMGLLSNNLYKTTGNEKYRSARTSDVKDYLRRTLQGRNELCNCGSGEKFKKCCGKVIKLESED